MKKTKFKMPKLFFTLAETIDLFLHNQIMPTGAYFVEDKTYLHLGGFKFLATDKGMNVSEVLYLKDKFAAEIEKTRPVVDGNFL